MAQQVACVDCGGFFVPDEQDVLDFLKTRADAAYLRRIPRPENYRKLFPTRPAYLAFILSGYCPYCREVKFGLAANIIPSFDEISTDKYLRAIAFEVRLLAGMQILDVPDDYIALVDDDDN